MGAPHNNASGVGTSWFPTHQLSNGLYVSGHRDQYKDKGNTISVPQMPYTGGDVKRSGELGKMFDIPVDSAAAKAKRAGLTTSTSLKASSSGASSSHSGSLSGGGSRSAFSASGPLSSAGVPWQFSKSTGSHSGPLTDAPNWQGSMSGHLGRSGDPVGAGSGKNASLKTSGPLPTSNQPKNSGPQIAVLPATGLITSGPISSGPLSSAGATRKSVAPGPIEVGTPSSKLLSGPGANNQAMSNLSHDPEYSFRKSFPKVVLWTVIPLFVMGFLAGAFIIAAVKNPILLIVVGGLFGVVVLLLLWNTCWGKRSVTGFLATYPDAELGTAKDGQFVKVTGVVTCGSVPLESSYQKVSRCIYTSTGLYEYRNFYSKPAGQKHRRFTWGLRYRERYVVDFYISDFQTGLRALVKAGYGARVSPYVEESAILDVNATNKELPSDFLRWLTGRNLSADDRVMRLKEGFVKEGSTVTVTGVVQRHENVLMIVPPPAPLSTGCQWFKLLLPATMEGIILKCEDVSKVDGVPL